MKMNENIGDAASGELEMKKYTNSHRYLLHYLLPYKYNMLIINIKYQ
jgi:hypothetical protein